MSFDFDAPEYQQKASGTPSIKVLNEAAAFFIGNDNLDAINWTDRSVGEPYRQKTSKVGEDNRPLYINGISIANPSLLIMDESPLLVRDKKSQKFIGLYDADTYNNQLEQPYRIYQVVMVDKQNQPFHKGTLQLTATGNFSVNFSAQLEKFREECIAAYNTTKGIEDKNKRVIRWHSFWVFTPKFKPEKRGKDADVSSFACITVGFNRPDSGKLAQINIAMNPMLKDFTASITDLQSTMQDSWLARVKKTQSSNGEFE